MPIRIWIEPEKELIRAEAVGDLSAAEMIAAVNAAVEDPAFRPGFSILSDHRHIGKALTPEQASELVGHLSRLTRYFAGVRWAVVSTKTASVGMMRLLSVHLEQVPLTLEVFSSMNEAERWLAETDPKEAP
jgi:hypothetical protein